MSVVILCLVVAVTDGDTFRCAAGERIRVFGIQAPEVGQPGARASTANLRSLARGRLRCEKRGLSYRRIVAVCRNSAGVDVGRAQIAAGHASEWCRYSRGYYGRCG